MSTSQNNKQKLMIYMKKKSLVGLKGYRKRTDPLNVRPALMDYIEAKTGALVPQGQTRMTGELVRFSYLQALIACLLLYPY